MQRVRLPSIPIAWKWPFGILGAVIFTCVYSLLGWFPWQQAELLPLLDLDRAVPFLPWTVLVYISDYLFIVLLVRNLDSTERLSRASYTVGLGAVLTFGIFLLFPTVYPRQQQDMQLLWAWLFKMLYGIDSPGNCFPSLHVSMTLICAYLFHTKYTLTRIGVWGWALAICISTLTTKQHYAIDVFGGIFISFVALWISGRWCEFTRGDLLSPSMVAKENEPKIPDRTAG